MDKQVCGLCCQIYMKKPKLLPCFHSYCLKCLKKHVKETCQQNTFLCPLCDEKIKLPSGGVKELETNIYIKSELISKEKHHCDFCGPDVDAENHCLYCYENYCKKCSETHTKLKVSRSHSLLGLSDASTKRNIPIKKISYCVKHPKEELKVICKDCDMVLCLICKLTEHEKHLSRDIADEAKTIKEALQQKISEAYNILSVIEDVEKRQKSTKSASSEQKDTELYKLQNYTSALKELIDKQIDNVGKLVSNQFDSVCAKMTSSAIGTRKDMLSIRNFTLQIEKMMAISDNISIINQSRDFEKKMVKLSMRFSHYRNQNPERRLELCKFTLTDRFLNIMFSPGFIKETPKVVTKLSEYPFQQRHSRCCFSLSLFQNTCMASFGLSSFLYKVDTQDAYFKEFYQIMQTDNVDCYYSDQKEKEVKVWRKASVISSTVQKFDPWQPYGIAYRNRADYEELLVCLTNEDPIKILRLYSRLQYEHPIKSLRSYSPRKLSPLGQVLVVPLSVGQAEYEFLSQTEEVPTRVAVNKHNGFVCLSYQYISKITIHTEDGTLIQVYDYRKIGLFNWFSHSHNGVCFDNENCIIIADTNGDRVLRVNIFGELVQVLVEEERPTAVAVSHDDKLWVGFETKTVTVYQLKDK